MTRKRTSKGTSDKARSSELPRALTSSQEQLLQQVSKQVPVRQRDGTETSMSISEALTQQHIQTALKGSPHALNQLLSQIRIAEEITAEQNEVEVASWTAFRNSQKQKLEQLIKGAEEEGRSEEEIKTLSMNFYPHPDDINVHAKGVDLKGPYDEESLARYQEVADIRDAFILQHVFDQRSPQPCAADLEDLWERYDETSFMVCGFILEEKFLQQRAGLLLAMNLEGPLPERFKLSNVDYLMKHWNFGRLTKRELQRECFQKWKSLKADKPRGWLSPRVDQAILAVSLTQELMRQFVRLNKEGKVTNDLQCMDLIHEAMHTVKAGEYS